MGGYGGVTRFGTEAPEDGMHDDAREVRLSAQAAEGAPAHGLGTRWSGRTARSRPFATAAGGTARLGSSRYGYTFRRALLLADLVGIAAAAAVAGAVLELAGRAGFEPTELAILVAFVPVWIVLAHGVGLYHLPERKVDHSFADESGPVFLVATVWSWLHILLTAAVDNGPTELLGACVLWVALTISVLVSRAIARRIASNRSWHRRPVLLIGDRQGTDRVLSRLRRHPEWGLNATFRLRTEGDQAMLENLTDPTAGDSRTIDGARDDDFIGRIADVACELDVDRVILGGGSTSLSERTDLARLLTEQGYAVDYVYGEPETLYASAVLHHLEGLPVLSVQPTRLSRGSAALKRALDLAASVAGLLLLSPLFALIAVLIKVDSRGPVFFRQPRIGRDGVSFNALKFRTMVEGADAMRPQLRRDNLHGNGNGNGLLKLREDPRVTRLGAKLRRWSLDELPQLWNVLRGEMSLVGPRPLPLDEASQVKGHFELRTQVRPGITGTWQTQGRSDIPFEEMMKLDYTYVAGWSLREDLRLLLRTGAVVARGRGAC
jgi:exopolysaccharide biosynthesis polyprenyl glycosylphosphotransferase